MKASIAKKQQVVSSVVQHLSRYSKGANTIVLARFSHMTAQAMNNFRETARVHSTIVKVIKRRLASRALDSDELKDLIPFASGQIAIMSSEGIGALVTIDKFNAYERIFPVAAIIESSLVSTEDGMKSIAKCGSVDGVYALALGFVQSVAAGALRFAQLIAEQGEKMSKTDLLEKVASATDNENIRKAYESLLKLSVGEACEMSKINKEVLGLQDAAPTQSSGSRAIATEEASTSVAVASIEKANLIAFVKKYRQLVVDGCVKDVSEVSLSGAKELAESTPFTIEAVDAAKAASIKEALKDIAVLK